MSERIAAMIEQRGARPLVIPYLTAGYPRREETLDLLLALEAGGADAIELGMPFSDPLADGPVIQGTSHLALEGGMSHRGVLDLAAAFRAKSSVPLILFGYLNPILAFGSGKFFREAVAAGADGLIVPDLPPEEAESLLGEARGAGLSWIFLAAPTSSPDRLRRIDSLSTDFNYCVSVAGVTGARDALGDSVVDYLRRAAAAMKKPFVVGFGISRPEHVKRFVPPAAGVVVGSALLKAIGEEPDAAGRKERAESFLRELRGDG